MSYPNSNFPELEWQRLAAAIAAGNCAKATEHLDALVRDDATKRELVERGRTSREAVAVVGKVFEGSPVIDGVLKDASIYPYDGDGSKVCSGAIHGDRKARFRDGERVTTSRIISGPDAGGIIHTRNSVYRVELAA